MLKEVPGDIKGIDIGKAGTEFFRFMDLDIVPGKYYKLAH